MHQLKKLALVSLSALILTACGGGGGGGGAGGSDKNDGPTVRTGNFVDSPVAGVRYKTPSRSGLTGPNGEFKYLDGELVTFSIGNTTLGVAEGQETVTPFTLFGIAPLAKEAKISAALAQDSVSSFERALNVAMLLQNLDVDGNPDNGIDLGDAHTQLANDTINLLVKSRDFLDQIEVRSAKRKLSIDHRREMLAAVTHLYENLEIEIESNQVSKFNSIIDESTLQSVDYDYDANGLVMAERTDTNGDGEADIVKTFEYDDNGNPVRSENSKTGVVETMNYDGNNNLISRQSTSDAGSSVERYNYNNNGKISRFELDSDNNGAADAVTRYYYEAGRLASYTVDKDGDSVIDTVARYVYDNGRVATFEEDRDNNGIADLIIAYSYDENGNRQSFNINVSPDGFPSAPGRFTYDENNNVIGYALDNDLDGEYEYIESYTYNSQGQRTSYFRDTDGDGNWDNRIQYFYNEDGKRIQMAEDQNGDGIADKVWAGDYQPKVLENAWDLILQQG
ncbi:MAG: hypothetical protein C9356_17395 [Oleiphilus sp.]|nr:MAG: hypothetical protein C9356_17395 [Oleiphilus sp.]